jgi:peptide/nickel transport system substrate-binding protein/oligopeptide transport system substrate-binding protein
LAGKVDVVLGGRLPTCAGSARRSANAGPFDPAPGLFGLLVENDRACASANREALAMAMDRAGLAGAIGVPGWPPRA